ncbi:MAG: glucokinase [Actinomycetes bacterium]|jgi:glucokinase
MMREYLMGLTVGIDVGGTKIAGGVVDDVGAVLQMDVRKTVGRNPEALEATIIGLIAEYKSLYSVEAVGVGFAGFIDEKRSRVLMSANLGWQDEPLKAALESQVGLPVVVENDANAAAWGEYRFGGDDIPLDMVCVTVGTGIGGGLILDGSLYRGAHGVAAEFGHLGVDPSGRLCGCGNRGCWEQYASGNALVREARMLAADRRSEASILLGLGDGTPEGVSGENVTEAARLDDPVALAAFDYLARWLGQGIADLTALLDPACFVIGGGVSEAGDLLLGPTRRSFFASLSGGSSRPTPEIRLAKLGNKAGLIGAADLARI